MSAHRHDIHQTHRKSAGGSAPKRRDSRRGVLAEQPQPRVDCPRVDEWVAEAFTRTVVERIDSPPGFSLTVLWPRAPSLSVAASKKHEMRCAQLRLAGPTSESPAATTCPKHRPADRSAPGGGHGPTGRRPASRSTSKSTQPTAGRTLRRRQR